MKKMQYEQSKFKYLLKNSRDLSHKLFRLTEEQLTMALKFGFEPVPVLFRVKTRKSFTKPTNYLLKILDREYRQGTTFKILKLSMREKNYLESIGIQVFPYKYRLNKY